jgi:hypothetical protein
VQNGREQRHNSHDDDEHAGEMAPAYGAAQKLKDTLVDEAKAEHVTLTIINGMLQAQLAFRTSSVREPCERLGFDARSHRYGSRHSRNGVKAGHSSVGTT